MRRCLGILAVACLAVASIGCSGIIKLATEEAGDYIVEGSEKGVFAGLKALSKDDATYQKVKDASAIAKDAIDKSVLPLFSGASLNVVTVGTANQALSLLDGKVSGIVKGTIQLAIDSALMFIKMPANPTDALSDDQRKLIVTLFTGISAGLKDFQGWAGPGGAASRDVGPPPKLAWAKGGTK